MEHLFFKRVITPVKDAAVGVANKSHGKGSPQV
jgi:hypothetical protein